MLPEDMMIDGDTDRRGRILSAAERAFVRHGFQGASMQHVAAEAKMSAGNLYRYFQSKEAIVSGLIAREQESLARDFHVLASAPDVWASLEQLLHLHLVTGPIGRQHIILQIWAEHARNPAMADLCTGIERDVHQRLASLVAALCDSRSGAAAIEPDFVVRVMTTVMSGLFKRRVTEPGFDGRAEVALALGIFQAAFTGILQPYRGTETPPERAAEQRAFEAAETRPDHAAEPRAFGPAEPRAFGPAETERAS